MLLAQREASKDAELLVLRHENAMLRRRTSRVRYQPGDRLWLAPPSRRVPHPPRVDFVPGAPVVRRRFSALIVIEHGPRRVHLAGITANPNGAWTTQAAPKLPDGPGPARGFSHVPDQGSRWPVHHPLRRHVPGRSR